MLSCPHTRPGRALPSASRRGDVRPQGSLHMRHSAQVSSAAQQVLRLDRGRVCNRENSRCVCLSVCVLSVPSWQLRAPHSHSPSLWHRNRHTGERSVTVPQPRQPPSPRQARAGPPGTGRGLASSWQGPEHLGAGWLQSKAPRGLPNPSEPASYWTEGLSRARIPSPALHLDPPTLGRGASPRIVHRPGDPELARVPYTHPTGLGQGDS